MHTELTIKTKVRQFLFDSVMMTEAPADFGDDTSLLRRSIIDSTGIIELVTFLEDAFAIKIADHEIVPANLDSLNKISLFVRTKLAPLSEEAA